MNSSEVIKKAIKKVAEELGISPFIVEAIWKHQFRFIKDRVRELDIRPIRLPMIGLFVIKPSKLKMRLSGNLRPMSWEERVQLDKDIREYRKKRKELAEKKYLDKDKEKENDNL